MTFNRVFAHREVTVSKSYVHRMLRQNAHAVAKAHKAIRRAQPMPVTINQRWGLDMTGRADEQGRIHTVLGIVDHGSRLAVRLARLPRKFSWMLLGHLCLTIAQFGKPKFIRTDNESCFTGKVFTRGLRWMGIGHQRSNLHCPWQNGRVERLFGTLTGVLRRLTEGDLLKSGAASTTFTSRVDPAGQIVLTATRSGDSGATGSGTLATVRFRTTSAALRDNAVVLLNAAPTEQEGRPVAIDLPEPHALRVAP